MSNDVSVNRQAFHNYDIIEKFEAGMVLTGTEIKSARDGRVNLKDAYGLVKAGEIWLLNCHISPYSHGNYANHEPLRTRKLLLHRSEIDELLGKTKAKGQTVIPLRLYINEKGRAKIELGLARGKRRYEKRQVIKEREATREMDAAVRRRVPRT